MDILKNGYLQHLTIKRFTLSATAAAILSLNAETASAVSCPTIINSSLGAICDFDTGASVTVANNGSVFGINMNAFSASQITINAGGVIQATGTGVGINLLNSSSLINGISNNGTISALQTGIFVSSSSSVGGITNNGAITVNGTGVIVRNNSTINGDILNNGTITAGGNDEGIFVGFTSNVNGNISNTGFINSANGNGILVSGSSNVSGGISNGGTITVGDTGISILNEVHIGQSISNTGSIIAVQKGMNIRQSTTVDGNISNTGTINAITGTGIGIFVSSSTVDGTISNSGTISAGGTGIGVASGVVNGHISNSGIIQGGINAINVDAGSRVNDIDILGSHARVIGGVTATVSNFNITSGAIFTSEGSYNVKNFNIATNAIFNMANAISVANAVNNAGTLSVGNTAQTITGNYTQNNGGLFQIGAVSLTSYGQLTASGTVDLSASGNLNVQVLQNSTLHQGGVLSNVISGGVLIAPTNGFNVTSNSYVWQFTPKINTSQGVDLTATINPTASTANQGTYLQGATNVILGQLSAGNPSFSLFATLPTQSAFNAAVAQATPELTNENTQVVQLAAKAVMDVAPMWAALHGKSAGDAMLYQPGKLWMKPYGATMTQDKQNSVPGFDATAYGVVIGKDLQLLENWMFGGAVAVGNEDITGNSALSRQSVHSNVYQGIVYGAKQFPNYIYIAAQGLVGFGNNDSKRTIPLYASSANATYNSWFTNLRAALGWSTFALNQNLILTPEVDISYFYINQNSFKETGSLMDLNVASNNTSSLTLGAYGNAAYHLTTLHNQQDVTLTGYVGIAGNVLNNQPQTAATFVAGGPSFATYGVQNNSVLFRGGVGVSVATPAKPLSVNLNYDLQAGNNAYSGVGSLTVKYLLS